MIGAGGAATTGGGGGGAAWRGGGDGGTGWRGGIAAGRGGVGCGAAAFAGAAGLPVSSSAMMRRMEARISSIEGSCAFAVWLISESHHFLHATKLNPGKRGESPAHSICTRNAVSMA